MPFSKVTLMDFQFYPYALILRPSTSTFRPCHTILSSSEEGLEVTSRLSAPVNSEKKSLVSKWNERGELV